MLELTIWDSVFNSKIQFVYLGQKRWLRLRQVSWRELRQQASRRRHFTFSELHIKLIEPTFSKKNKKKQIRFSRVHKRWRGRPRVSLSLPLSVSPHCWCPPLSLEKQIWAKYKRAQLLLQYYKLKVSWLWKGHQVKRQRGAETLI